MRLFRNIIIYSNIIMVFVHSRITSEDDDLLDKVVLWVRSNAKCILAVKEISKEGKKHIHVMSEFSKTVSTFGQKLTKEFPNLKGNGSHSTKEFKESYDQNLRYLSKGTKQNSPVVLFTTLELNEIEDAHKRFWIEQQKWLTEHGVKPEDKTKKQREPNFKEKVIAQLPQGTAAAYSALQSIYHPSDYEMQELSKVKNIIIYTTIRCFGKYAKDLDDNIITRSINGVLLKCVTDYGHESEQKVMIERIANRSSHNFI